MKCYVAGRYFAVQMFKVGDRRRVEAVLFEELGIADKAEYDKLPREIQLAGWRGTARARAA